MLDIKTLGNPHQIVNTVNNHEGKLYNHGGLYPRVFRRWCIRGKFAGKHRRLKPLGFHETPEVNTSVVSFTPTGVKVKLVHTAPVVYMYTCTINGGDLSVVDIDTEGPVVEVGLSCGVWCGIMLQFMRDACTLHMAYYLEHFK